MKKLNLLYFTGIIYGNSGWDNGYCGGPVNGPVLGKITLKEGKHIITMHHDFWKVGEIIIWLTAYHTKPKILSTNYYHKEMELTQLQAFFKKNANLDKTHHELLKTAYFKELNALPRMTLVQIKAFAKRMGLKGYSSLKKKWFD